jgi:glycosyltransferase involved in cell wall biosynthesis
VADRNVPQVLLVTGAYYPEISAAAVQCRAVAQALRGRAAISVLTTAVDPMLPSVATVDDVVVYRVHVNVASRASKAAASLRLAACLVRARRRYAIVHVHGFSRKNVPVALLARLLGKRIVLSLHTAGQDEPAAAARGGRLSSWAFRSTDLVLSVSPDLMARWCAANLPRDRIRLVPNGVDTMRFHPVAGDCERAALRRALGWPEAEPIVLFVGFFSRDKRPDLIFRAWRRLLDTGMRSRLALVGAKGSGYYEIDASIADRIRRDAEASGCADELMFVEPTHDIEQYFRAADVFVLPSIREAHPLALLEAMACGLPSIATRLPGSTDVLIDDRSTGRLFPPDDEAALTGMLRELLSDPAAARAIGARARDAITARYDIGRTADGWLAAYDTLMNGRR